MTPSPADDPATRFHDLGLADELLSVLGELGYEEPTPIQAEAIPPLLAGRDLLGMAATGTGKTAAFALPLLQRLRDSEVDRGGAPIGLVLAPTRELAMQVSQAIHRYGRGLDASVLPVYGGQPIWRQLKALERGIDVVVGTPGRVLDHLGRGSLSLDHVEVVVLDEADEMLDMGFAEDIEAILAAGPEYRQTMLFSATMPGRIERLAREHLHEPVRITLDRSESTDDGAGPLIRQLAYVVHRADKPAALGRVLDIESPDAALVFCGTRVEVDHLTETMNGRGYRAEALHGGMDQQTRDRVMDRLRNATADLLIATDVAARGLDVEHLTHVVNYDVPSSPEAYVHRIGRVGRAGREGTAITLVEPRQHRLVQAIERHTKSPLQVQQVPTVASLRARRLDLARAGIREALLVGDLDDVRPVVDALSEEFDVLDIALAAVKLAHEALGGDESDAVELPEARLHTDGGGKGATGAKRPKAGQHTGRAKHAGASRERATHGGDYGRVYVGLGRAAGIRPADLVGAIANESSVSGNDIGNIEITQRFSLVEVPAEAVEEVVAALRNSTVKGKKATVRRDRGFKPKD